MEEGLTWEVSRCSQGSGGIVAGFEAHLLWSVLISFGFLSFCGIKVAAAAKAEAASVWGCTGC
jgi:hypothetical protein